MEETIAQLNYQPANLSAEELENPMEVITAYFSNHPLHKSREAFWDLYKNWLYHSSEFADQEQFQQMLFFYTQTIEFMNACYILSAKVEQ